MQPCGGPPFEFKKTKSDPVVRIIQCMVAVFLMALVIAIIMK
jgi:hypothetical protein